MITLGTLEKTHGRNSIRVHRLSTKIQNSEYIQKTLEDQTWKTPNSGWNSVVKRRGVCQNSHETLQKKSGASEKKK